MARNRKKYSTPLPIGSLTKWVVLAIFLGIIGLSYVYLKNQLHVTGDEIKTLEAHLDNLNKQQEDVLARVASLSSRTALQRRLGEGFIQMVPLADDRIVRINGSAPRIAQEIRPVVNENVTK